MKKCLQLLLAMSMMLFFITIPANADVLRNREMVAPYYQKYGTAWIADLSKNGGTIVLTASGSPAMSYTLFNTLQNTYCKVADLPIIGEFLPGCNYVEFADGFLHYVDSNVKVYMLLKDPSTGKIIGDPNGYVMRDGQVIWLGNDHPAYEIWFKTYGPAASFVRLKLVDNVQWY